MTEKEFLDKLKDEVDYCNFCGPIHNGILTVNPVCPEHGLTKNAKRLNNDIGNRLRLLALKLAKDNGAKFDPETVELPKLKLLTPDARRFGVVSKDNDIAFPFTREQAEEIIRRCELIPKLRDIILDIHYTNEDILAILDGRKEIE